MSKELSQEEKMKLLMAKVNKGFKGRNPLKLASDFGPKDKMSTGVDVIDKHIAGGWQKGNTSVIYGGNSCGKSSLCLSTVVEAQKQNQMILYIDLEHKFDPERAMQFGVDLTKLMLVEDIEYAEEAMDMINQVCPEGLIDLVIVDSIQGMAPKGEQETKKGKKKSIEDDEMALLARKLSKFFRNVSNSLSQSKTGLLLVGQLRMNLGSFIVTGKLSGGNALEHYAVLIMQMRRGAKANAPVEAIKEYYLDEETEQERYRTVKKPVGFECVCKIEKSHIFGASPEGTNFSLPFFTEHGFNKTPAEVVNVEDTQGEETEKPKAKQRGRKNGSKREISQGGE